MNTLDRAQLKRGRQLRIHDALPELEVMRFEDHIQDLRDQYMEIKATLAKAYERIRSYAERIDETQAALDADFPQLGSERDRRLARREVPHFISKCKRAIERTERFIEGNRGPLQGLRERIDAESKEDFDNMFEAI